MSTGSNRKSDPKLYISTRPSPEAKEKNIPTRPEYGDQRYAEGSREGMVFWKSDPEMCVALCVILRGAHLLGHATDYDLVFNDFSDLGITAENLCDHLRTYFPRAFTRYEEKSGGKPLTPGIIKDRLDKMFREGNMKKISGEHPINHVSLQRVFQWVLFQYKKTGGKENTLHNIRLEDIPGKVQILEPKRRIRRK